MRRINFDHLACSPLLPEAREAMLSFLSEDMGNPLSRHFLGEKPAKALEEARAHVANFLSSSTKLNLLKENRSCSILVFQALQGPVVLPALLKH